MDKIKTEVLPADESVGDGSASTEAELVNRVLGRVQMAFATKELLTTVGTFQLKQIKESKAYKALAGRSCTDPFGNKIADMGTWSAFCRMVGSSKSKVDEDILNLDKFGQQALDVMQNAGIGYREIRKLRKLPDEDLAEIEGKIINAGDKTEVIEIIEDLVEAKQAAVAKSAQVSKHLAQADSRLDTARCRINELEAQLADDIERSALHPVICDIRDEALTLSAGIMDGLDRLESLIGKMAGDEIRGALSDADDSESQFSAAASTLFLALDAVRAKTLYRIKLFGEKVGFDYAPKDDTDLPVIPKKEADMVAARIETILGLAENEAIVRQVLRDENRPRGRGRPKTKNSLKRT